MSSIALKSAAAASTTEARPGARDRRPLGSVQWSDFWIRFDAARRLAAAAENGSAPSPDALRIACGPNAAEGAIRSDEAA